MNDPATSPAVGRGPSICSAPFRQSDLYGAAGVHSEIIAGASSTVDGSRAAVYTATSLLPTNRSIQKASRRRRASSFPVIQPVLLIAATAVYGVQNKWVTVPRHPLTALTITALESMISWARRRCLDRNKNRQAGGRFAGGPSAPPIYHG